MFIKFARTARDLSQAVHHTPPEAYGSTNVGLESRSDLSPLNQRRLFGSVALSREAENTSLSDPWANVHGPNRIEMKFVLQVTTYQPRPDEWDIYIDAQLEPSMSS